MKLEKRFWVIKMLLDITNRAFNDISNDFTKTEQELIFEKLEYLEQNYSELVKTKNIKKLENSSVSRYKISSDIRAIFITFFVDNDGTIAILRVLKRKESYENKNKKNYEKQAQEYKTKKSHKQ